MKRKIIACTVAVALLLGATIAPVSQGFDNIIITTASAEVYNKDKYEKTAVDYKIELSKAEIKDGIWQKMSPSNIYSSKEHPRSSFYYHMCCEWVDEYYGYYIYEFGAGDYNNVTCNWNDIDDIIDDYKEYWQHFEKTHMDLLEDEIYYICSFDYDTETYGDERYHFEFTGGKWLQLDDNNNVVDSFEPVGNFYPEDDIDDDDSSESHTPNVNEYVYDPETGEVVLKGDDTSDNSSEQVNSNDSKEQQLGDSDITTDTDNTDDSEVTEDTDIGVPDESDSSIPDSSSADDGGKEDDGGSIVPLVAIPAAIVVGGGAGAGVFIIRKKKLR